MSSTSSSSSSSTAASYSATNVIPDIPEGADPLDYLDQEKLKKAGEALPKTKEGVQKLMDSMPITSDSIPEEKHDKPSEYHALDAIISETPADERAEHFKTSGNEAYSLASKMKKELAALDEKREKLQTKKLNKEEVKEEDKVDEDHYQKLKSAIPKRFADALEYYGQALEQNMFSKHLKCQIYLNRAQVHLTMENYGKCCDDCDEALKLEPGHAKACYRGAQASLAVNRFERGLEFVKKGLVDDKEKEKINWMFRAEQKSLRDLEAKLKKKWEEEKVKEREREEIRRKKEADEAVEKAVIDRALQSRGLKRGPMAFHLQGHYDSTINIDVDTGALIYPILFLYPLDGQSDFIQSSHESVPLSAYLDQMFPPKAASPPWDTNKKYTLNNISVWIDLRGNDVPANSTQEEDVANRVLVNPNQSLASILSNQKLAKKKYVIPGIPTFLIIPK